MDTVRALIYFFVGFLLAITAGIASASFTAPLKWHGYETSPTTRSVVTGYGGCPTVEGFTTIDNAICPALGYGAKTWRGSMSGSCTVSGASITYQCTATGTASKYAKLWPACPANSTLNGSLCTCDAGYVESGSTCVQPACPEGQEQDPNNANACRTSCLTQTPIRLGVGISGTGADAGTFCMNGGDGKGCTFTKQGPNGCVGTGSSLKCYYSELKATGGTCNLTSTPAPATTGDETASAQPTPQPPLSPEGQCVAKGMSYGEVNGQVVCVAKADSSQPTTSETTTQNADGTSTTTGTTTNVDGSVSKTTTQRDAGGNVTSTVTNTYLTTNDFCAQNADLTICGESSASTSEGCDTPPACSGDAIQCAILTEQWRTRCANVLQETDANVQAGQTAIAAEGSTLEQLGVTTETIDIAGQIEQTAFLGGSCVSDQTISLGHYGSFTIPFSSLCGTFNILGNILVALAFIGAARITTII